MSQQFPLMPKATAVWLVENTKLSFEQIAEFCGMHMLEIQAIADGDVAFNIRGLDPVLNGQLTWENIHACEKDAQKNLELNTPKEVSRFLQKGKKYVSQSKRTDRPNAIAWVIKNHPEISDAQLVKVLRTTKPTIAAIREKTIKGYAAIQPQNPVTLGLCSEADLAKAIALSAKRVKKTDDKKEPL